MFITYCRKCNQQTEHISGLCRICKDRIKEENLKKDLEEFNKLDLDSKLEYIFRKLHEKHVYPTIFG